MGETRIALYKQWLAGRTGDMVDNSRENIINMAMEESCLKDEWKLFDIVIVTDQEAVEWMFHHVPTLKSISTPRVINFLIKILQSEIGYVNRVATGEEQSDIHRRPTIDEMNELIRILSAAPASAAPASAAPASAALMSLEELKKLRSEWVLNKLKQLGVPPSTAGGSHRRRHKKSAKKSKKSKSRKSKKSKKTKSRRH